MPRYDFHCEGCGTVREHIYRMADVPSELACDCGGVARMQIGAGVQVCVRGNPAPFKQKYMSPVAGWEKGVDADAEEARFAKRHAVEKRMAQAVAPEKRRKDEIRKVASIPGALFRARANEFGKNYWTDEGKVAIEREGLSYEK